MLKSPFSNSTHNSQKIRCFLIWMCPQPSLDLYRWRSLERMPWAYPFRWWAYRCPLSRREGTHFGQSHPPRQTDVYTTEWVPSWHPPLRAHKSDIFIFPNLKAVIWWYVRAGSTVPNWWDTWLSFRKLVFEWRHYWSWWLSMVQWVRAWVLWPWEGVWGLVILSSCWRWGPVSPSF